MLTHTECVLGSQGFCMLSFPGCNSLSCVWLFVDMSDRFLQHLFGPVYILLPVCSPCAGLCVSCVSVSTSCFTLLSRARRVHFLSLLLLIGSRCFPSPCCMSQSVFVRVLFSSLVFAPWRWLGLVSVECVSGCHLSSAFVYLQLPVCVHVWVVLHSSNTTTRYENARADSCVNSNPGARY